MPTSQTNVQTERASRYLVQLCEHLDQLRRRGGHRRKVGHNGPGVQRVESTDTHGIIEFPFGTCELRADDDGLHMQLAADDEEALRYMQQMLTSRIETIGRRDSLVVTW